MPDTARRMPDTARRRTREAGSPPWHISRGEGPRLMHQPIYPYILQMPTYEYGAQNAPFGHVQGWKPLGESDPCPRMRDVTAASESTAARARGAL
jgi:hypothetical protein